MSTGQAVVSLQIQLGGANSPLAALAAQMQQIAAAQAALLGNSGGLGGAAAAANSAVVSSINALIQALQQNTRATQNPPPPPSGGGPGPIIGPMPSHAVYGGSKLTPAQMNALVMSQAQVPGGALAGPTAASRAMNQNLQAQAFDVFTQLGSGTSPMLIMIQQGPQVIQALGGVGAAVDAVKASIAAMGTTILRGTVLLGGLGLALGALAVVMAADARAAQAEIARRELQHKAVLSLRNVERQLADAKNQLATATGDQTKAEEAATRIRLLAGRSVLDFTEAQREQRKELNELILGTSNWLRLQRGVVVAATAAQMAFRAMQGDTTVFMKGEFERTLKTTSDLLDMFTGNEAAVAEANRSMKTLDEARKRHWQLTKELRDVQLELDAAGRKAASNKEYAKYLKEVGEAAYTAAQQASDARMKLRSAIGEAMTADTEQSPETAAAVAYSQRISGIMQQAIAAGVDVTEIQPELDKLQARFQLTLGNIAEDTRRAQAAAAESVMGMADALARGPEVLTPAQKVLADYNKQVYDLVHGATEAGVALADIEPQLLEAQTRFQSDMARAAAESAGRTAQQVVSAVADPLGAIAGAHPIAAAVVAGIRAAANLPDTLNSLTKLFSDAAAGLTVGGPAIAKFIGDLFGSVIPAMLEAADDFVIGIVDNIPAIIEGLAAGLPRLAVAFVELFSPLMAARLAVSLVRALFNPETWVNAGKALGQGFLDAVAALWKTLRDLIEAILPGRQFGNERTGLFKGGGVFDDLEYYTAGAVFGRGDGTGLFQSDGWLGGLFGGRRNRGSSTTNVYQGGVVVIGSDAPRALQVAQTRYAGVYGGP